MKLALMKIGAACNLVSLNIYSFNDIDNKISFLKEKIDGVACWVSFGDGSVEATHLKQHFLRMRRAKIVHHKDSLLLHRFCSIANQPSVSNPAPKKNNKFDGLLSHLAVIEAEFNHKYYEAPN